MTPSSTTPQAIPISAVMHHGVISCPPPDRRCGTWRRRWRTTVHCVVVSGLAPTAHHSERLVWGIVSDIDLMGAAASDALGTEAGQVAATEIVTVDPGEDVERAAQLMSAHDCAHLVVISPESGEPIGVVSTLDVAGALAPSLRSGGRGA
jgi:CBS domain-containing protein